MKNFTSCYKELHFLKFFFKRLKKNDSMRYTEDFPYLSLCGKERNFVRCDDLPIVFTEVIKGSLISEGNLNLVPLPIKNAKLLPWAEKLNFPPIALNKLSKLSAQGSDLALFIGDRTKVKIPSEIKPPLKRIVMRYLYSPTTMAPGKDVYRNGQNTRFWLFSLREKKLWPTNLNYCTQTQSIFVKI